MKILTAIAIAATLLSGISIADAQNAPTSTVGTSPASVNKGNLATKPSGAEAQSAATQSHQKVSGTKKFCKQTASGTLNCNYASMAACKKNGKPGNLECVANPNSGT